uniref:Uncharacterized protein n=1 Tax=Alexandrium monilatum TaxID=311494 RepID=A0A7S4RQG6_9DINO
MAWPVPDDIDASKFWVHTCHKERELREKWKAVHGPGAKDRNSSAEAPFGPTDEILLQWERDFAFPQFSGRAKRIVPGERAQVVGMSQRPQLNGATAEILGYGGSGAERGFVAVRVLDGEGSSKRMMMRPKCLQPLTSASVRTLPTIAENLPPPPASAKGRFARRTSSQASLREFVAPPPSATPPTPGHARSSALRAAARAAGRGKS